MHETIVSVGEAFLQREATTLRRAQDRLQVHLYREHNRAEKAEKDLCKAQVHAEAFLAKEREAYKTREAAMLEEIQDLQALVNKLKVDKAGARRELQLRASMPFEELKQSVLALHERARRPLASVEKILEESAARAKHAELQAATVRERCAILEQEAYFEREARFQVEGALEAKQQIVDQLRHENSVLTLRVAELENAVRREGVLL